MKDLPIRHQGINFEKSVIFSSMPVINYYSDNLLLDRHSLHLFLLSCQQTSIEKKQKLVVSISWEMETVDPLAVMEAIAKPNQIYFYFEKPDRGEAIAAIDTVMQLNIAGPQRFDRARDFIHSCLANTITSGAIYLPLAGPHFFCSFPFFSDHLSENIPFPSATIFLPRWQVSLRKHSCVFVANLVIHSASNVQRLSETIWNVFCQANLCQNIILNGVKKQNFTYKQNNQSEQFTKSVQAALKSIENNHYSKIVLAHAIDVVSENKFNIVHSLNQLRKIHRDCYIFATSNGKGQTFIGASPERLVTLHDRLIETDALAGSAPRGKTPTEDTNLANNLISDEKERREHQVVIDFIVQRLSRLGITPHLSPSSLRQLSNIQHLWTPIIAQVPPNVHLLEILSELHPTPAVAGVPRDIACQEIRRYESFERSLYAAPLGWVDAQGNGEFIVGIRSAIIDGCNARLYAGAGIVSGSDPHKELAEIQLKLQALLKALV